MILPFFKKKKEKINVALIMCPGWGAVQPPVGISYLKGFLMRRGINVKCFDLSLELYKIFPHKEYWELNYPEHFIIPEKFEKDVLPYLGSFIPASAKKILSVEPEIVGFSLFMSSLNLSLLLADFLKKIRPGIFIAGGGAEVTRLKRVLIDGIRDFLPVNRNIFENFDILIEGEGEESLADLSCIDRS
ncbi:MAG: hypothetical protein GF375_00145, partial [Candidatus Omnitrophica bacterium]|nr:hypothetical protein [Candidatus Omnitrophota bacterium]MBD3268579.1 hypothetical protein [Candidatus Omnitrophota bacterium]